MTLTIPWKNSTTAPTATLVQVSRLELARIRDVPGFLVASLRLRRATLTSPGCVGVSLRAAPFAKTFWTLSSWRDAADVSTFVRSERHLAVMERYRDRMAGSSFHTWNGTNGIAATPEWRDAIRRLDASTA